MRKIKQNQKKNKNLVVVFLSKLLGVYSNHFNLISIILLGFIYISVLIIEKTKIPLLICIILIPVHLLLGIIGLLKKSIGLLLDKKTNFTKLFISYTGAIIGLIALFSFIYILLNAFSFGYLAYGNCDENFNQNFAEVNDGSIVKDPWNTLYFSAITIFSIGYGDICPMGWNRLVSVFNAYAGHAFTTIILVIGLATYLKKKNLT